MNPVEIAQSAKRAFEQSQLVTHEERINALQAIKDSLAKHKDTILAANQRDIEVSLHLINISDSSQLALGSRDRSEGWSYGRSVAQPPQPFQR